MISHISSDTLYFILLSLVYKEKYGKKGVAVINETNTVIDLQEIIPIIERSVRKTKYCTMILSNIKRGRILLNKYNNAEQKTVLYLSHLLICLEIRGHVYDIIDTSDGQRLCIRMGCQLAMSRRS